MKFYLPRDVLKPKRWEGKPLAEKFKFLVANHGSIFFSLVIFGVITPPIAIYFAMNYEGSRDDVMKKYKNKYIVIRDDHPNIENIIKEKEAGREYFPEY